MENGGIFDGQISASSQRDASNSAILGRIREKGSWSADRNDVNQWLQVDLGNHQTAVTRVATQGKNGYSQWVTKYKLQHSYDGFSFQYYREQGKSQDKVSFLHRNAKSLNLSNMI